MPQVYILKCNRDPFAGFPTGAENMGGGGGGGLQKFMGGGGGLKMVLKNACKGVHLLVKLPLLSLQACKFTKNELLHTHFSRIVARF